MNKWKNRKKYKRYLFNRALITALAINFKNIVFKTTGTPIEIFEGGVVKINPNPTIKHKGRSATTQPLYVSVRAFKNRSKADGNNVEC